MDLSPSAPPGSQIKIFTMAKKLSKSSNLGNLYQYFSPEPTAPVQMALSTPVAMDLSNSPASSIKSTSSSSMSLSASGSNSTASASSSSKSSASSAPKKVKSTKNVRKRLSVVPEASPVTMSVPIGTVKSKDGKVRHFKASKTMAAPIKSSRSRDRSLPVNSGEKRKKKHRKTSATEAIARYSEYSEILTRQGSTLHCLVCNCPVSSHKTHFYKHIGSPKHVNNMALNAKNVAQTKAQIDFFENYFKETRMGGETIDDLIRIYCHVLVSSQSMHLQL